MKDKSLDSSYRECAIDEATVDPYDYASEVWNGIVDDKALKFYNKLRQAAGTSFDVFFKPAINCDTVDFVLISMSRGILLVNICEDLSKLDEAHKRIEAVKSNIFNIHLRTIKIDSVMNSSVFNCVKTALYFPNNSQEEISSKITELNNTTNANLDKQYPTEPKHTKDHFAYLYRFTDDTDLDEEIKHISSRGFRYDYYEELVNMISSKWHSYRDGDLNFRLSQRQKEIVRSDSKRLRVKGVAGCGKTQVVANRAVEQHLKTGDRVLIITFNISLIQYIRMRINQVPADFSPNMFEVINYHQFFKSKANLYADRRIQLSDFDDAHYFDSYRDDISKYTQL